MNIDRVCYAEVIEPEADCTNIPVQLTDDTMCESE